MTNKKKSFMDIDDNHSFWKVIKPPYISKIVNPLNISNFVADDGRFGEDKR
jgi:hypothetical protein